QGQMRPGQMQNPQMMQQGRPMGNPQMMQGQMRPGQMQNPQMMQGQMPNPQMMQNRPMPNRMPGNGAGMVMNPNGAGGLMTKTIDGQGNQAQQISGLRKQQSQGITIDESELGGAENSDGKVVNPWEAKNQTKGEKTEEEKKAEERAKLKSETRDSAFLKSNRSQEGGGLFSDADNNIVTQEVDSGKKSLVMVLLIVTCPIWIAALAAMIAFVAVCAVGVLLSAGLALASLVGAVGSLVVGAIALINTKIGSLVFGLGLAIMLFGLTALFIMLCIFLFKSVPGLFYGVLSIIKGARVKAHMFTLKK
ncbi:MAG: hypothetical protein VZR23_08855, partial [Lachnospiraceae bacterium]|nr:hypothetical protein [Lachnospiraceae bacterium]